MGFWFQRRLAGRLSAYVFRCEGLLIVLVTYVSSTSSVWNLFSHYSDFDKFFNLQNYVRTMGSHSMRKYFLTFRTLSLHFMLHFVMGSDNVYIFGHAYGLP